jgi:hypothetical protein
MSHTLAFELFRFWLRIRGDIRKLTPHIGESGSRRLPASASRGVADSPYRRIGESAIELLKEVRVQVVPEEPEK